MSRRCTWTDPPEIHCESPATHDETATDGEVWAHLCDKHHEMLESAMPSNDREVDPKKVLAYWIRAQGGPKGATKRMLGIES